MSSQRKIDSARANGAKSRGPVTTEGRAKSAQNSRRHALLAKHVVLDTEDLPLYKSIAQDYLNRFQPADSVETDCIYDMVSAKWQIWRCIALRKFILGIQTQKADVMVYAQPLHEGERTALAFGQEADNSKALSLILRYETAHERSLSRAYQMFLSLKASRPQLPDASPEPEFTPQPDPAPAPSPEPHPPQPEPSEAPEPAAAPVQNEPNPKIEQLISCPCGRAISPAAARSGYRCRCGRFHKPTAARAAAAR